MCPGIGDVGWYPHARVGAKSSMRECRAEGRERWRELVGGWVFGNGQEERETYGMITTREMEIILEYQEGLTPRGSEGRYLIEEQEYCGEECQVMKIRRTPRRTSVLRCEVVATCLSPLHTTHQQEDLVVG